MASRALSHEEDASNGDLKYTRNYIRHAMLAPLEHRFPGAVDRLLRCAGEMEDLASFAREQLAGMAAQLASSQGLCRHSFEKLQPGPSRELLAMAWERLRGKPGFQYPALLSLRKAMEAKKRNWSLQLDSRWALVLDPRRLFLVKRSPCLQQAKLAQHAGSLGQELPGGFLGAGTLWQCLALGEPYSAQLLKVSSVRVVESLFFGFREDSAGPELRLCVFETLQNPAQGINYRSYAFQKAVPGNLPSASQVPNLEFSQVFASLLE